MRLRGFHLALLAAALTLAKKVDQLVFSTVPTLGAGASHGKNHKRQPASERNRMRLRRLQLLLSTAAVLAGAAGCGGVGNKADDPQYVTVCSDRAITGSHVSRTRCHRKIDAAERERRDREFMEKVQYSTPRPQGSAGPRPR